MPTVVFVTGGTGFIGAHVARRLVRQQNLWLIMLVRAGSQEEAVLRLKRAWWVWPELTQAIGSRIRVLRGNLVEPFFGLNATDYAWLVAHVSHIIHCAADTTPNRALNQLRRINVEGTANVIELAKAAQYNHSFSRLAFVSTAYVAGKRRGNIGENDFVNKSGFSSLYEQTKYEAEQLILNQKRQLPITVFRPSLVIGNSETGEVKTFNTVYYLLKLYFMGQLRVVPASSKMRLNIVPVDYVADAVAKLTFDEDAEGLIFHLTAPKENAPTARELVEFVRCWARQNMGLKLPKVRFVPVSTGSLRGLLKLQGALKSSEKTINALQTLAPYFSQSQTFGRENTDRHLGPYRLNWQEYLPHILQYAAYYSFFHRSERTVHEQILYRLESKTKPVRYHEIIGDKVVDFKPEEVRQKMLQVAAALKAYDVKKGDVVAVVGVNCLRYLMIDVAVGLIGAVSCPIYVTSPIGEINKVLAETKAKLLFVGAPNILRDIDAVSVDIPIIKFSQQSPNASSRRVISWEKFLTHAQTANELAVFAPVEFDDLATIRYTYGSTGDPKGACLEHGNLRFVAEALASNFPWKTKTTTAAYLSFLPMNHVAEGVTATYSPYFVPAALDIYFLADFNNLQKALRLAKPTVFFCIPRFYEKLWTTIASNGLGRQYLGAKRGVKKRWLRRVLRVGALRKAGLSRCSQMIVGAACSSEVLLGNFKELGIEVHNAYGLSEAPLVAINKLGTNTTDTVGYPLAKTRLHIDEDGEVLVQGPQVMRGYLNREGEQPFRAGWFATGDIGELTAEGRLRILGRKKNVVVTSYGKKIPVERMEATFRGLPFVKECLVVGDDKPFCSAVFWVEQEKEEYKPLIEAAIEKVNAELERPAQIKRYLMIAFSSVEQGADALKSKRQELLKKFENAVESLYAEAKTSD